ncbi:dolichol kinase [Ciborinia camelliae]|nr:dolichol kinase [Ciborinia camelliae]
MSEHLDLNLKTAIREESRMQTQSQPQSHIQTQQSHAQKLREDAVRKGENVANSPRLERSPHPYHKRHEEMPFGSERIPVVGKGSSLVTPSFWTSRPSSLRLPSNPRTNPSSSGGPASPSSLLSAHSPDDELYKGVRVVVDGSPGGFVESTNSDSGTEADDEHFLKGLPAPRIKPHKGLRGENGGISSTPSPLLSPAILKEEIRWKENGRVGSTAPVSKYLTEDQQQKAIGKFRKRRRIEIIRRTTEAFLLCFVGGIIYRSQGVKEIIYSWRNALYPLRLLRHLSSRTPWKSPFPLTIPATFDPAPLLYPPALTMLVSILLSVSDPSGLLPSMILAISTLPKKLIPAIGGLEGRDMLHWALACMPLFTTTLTRDPLLSKEPLPLNPEVLVLVPPLHQALCTTLHYLTTTSLLSAELQLLSTALISLLLRASSPQAVILKALLWGGGIGILVTCTHVLRWGVALARVPTWRFRRPDSKKSGFRLSRRSLSFGANTLSVFAKDTFISDTSDDELLHDHSRRKIGRFQAAEDFSLLDAGVSRRNTLPTSTPSSPSKPMKDRTPSGRKKRSSSLSLQYFSKLTYTQATIRKWLYAVYVYICILVIILLGIREYVGKRALQHNEPVGWALGYLFGDPARFRFEVVSANLQRWIPLPPRSRNDPSLGVQEAGACEQNSWIERLRVSDFGLANTRLILSVYWLLIIITGLAIVFRLSRIYEVDTRRKVFHFMMVAMLLPATFIDPTYCSLALSLVLAIFLLLDMIRATQMPPLSRHLARFLTPYVDGRDLKGPVVISHIFLLIGCAVPLWLSLGSIDRVENFLHSKDGENYDGGNHDVNEDALRGWEVQKRETAMVAGVICVGLGDAAASLVGRRWGRRKWIWGGVERVSRGVWRLL